MLAAASKVWDAKFARWSSSEAQKGELDHCETDSIVMQKLMDIIYTGKTQVENRAELVALAKEAECFNMQSVKTVMENELKEFVSKETCCELLMIARNSGLDELDAACKEVLERTLPPSVPLAHAAVLLPRASRPRLLGHAPG